MEQEQRLTVEQVVELTIRDLESVRVPMGLMDDIGVPVGRAIRNLKECLRVWAISAQQQREAEQKAAEESKQSTTEEIPAEEAPEIIELPVEQE